MQHGKFSHPFEKKYTIFRVEVVSDLTYAFYSCVDISVNHILTKSGHLGTVAMLFFGVGVSKYCTLSSPNKIWALGAVTL